MVALGWVTPCACVRAEDRPPSVCREPPRSHEADPSQLCHLASLIPGTEGSGVINLPPCWSSLGSSAWGERTHRADLGLPQVLLQTPIHAAKPTLR